MDDDVRKLIEFLAEDCGWPLEDDQIDRSAWPVNNAELGLNDEVAIDSVEIFELRPLTTNQPWGVFFLAVKGTSDLSMALLRKLLRGLVKKKRASADTSSLQQWDLEDLMFVCSLDEPENTTRYFAHFKEQEKGLPKLMIGARWQDSQPENEIKAAKLKLKSNLKWPDNEADIDSWRVQWAKAFPVGHKEVIKTSANLSKALAKYAVIIKQNIPDLHDIEMEDGPIHQLHKAFREALIKDLSVDDFADMVAQTITYGLFSARASGSELTGIGTLSDCIPLTNPFLKDLFAEFSTLAGNGPADLDFDDLAIDELISMLNEINIDSIMEEFGTQFKGGKEDPIIHFYETFLVEYDAKRRAERGVFYTPKDVVSFIVRSVDEKLRIEFSLDDGLADITTWGEMVKENPELIIPNGISSDDYFVQILDPAVGTGTFIVEIISLIHQTMICKWDSKSEKKKNELWNHYVSKYLLPRLYGFELMMAPYSIAHLKISLCLRETGYTFEENSRLNIFLTNSLEPNNSLAKWVPEFLSKETKKVNEVKDKKRFTVIIGNPPYSIKSANLEGNVRKLVDCYKYLNGELIKERNALQFEKNLQDDYIKFIRFAEILITNSNTGIIGYVTNDSFLDSRSFRGMRQHLISSFSKIDIVDLHGSLKKNMKDELGNRDENVFEIQQGVCISFLTKFGNNEKNISVERFDLIGKRVRKSNFLKSNSITSLQSVPITPFSPFFNFSLSNMVIEEEYNKYPSIKDIFYKFSSGIKTHKDAF